MDQSTGLQLAVAILGGGGVSGAITQFLSLKKEKRWRAVMEAKIKQLEDQSPEGLALRIDQIEEFRKSDKRDVLEQIERLRTVMLRGLDALSRIQARLDMPAV